MSNGLLEKFRIFINSVYSRLTDHGPIDITGAMFNINDARDPNVERWLVGLLDFLAKRV